MPTPTLLTEKEAAQLLNISSRSVRNARSNGSLTYIKIGRLVRYRREDVDAFIGRAVIVNERTIGTIEPGRRRGRPAKFVTNTNCGSN